MEMGKSWTLALYYQIFWMENRWEIKTVPIILWRT